MFAEVASLLGALPDLDKLLSGLVAVPRQVTPKIARSGIDTLIYLKQALKLAPELAEALAGLQRLARQGQQGQGQGQQQGQQVSGSHPLVEAMIRNFTDPLLEEVDAAVQALVTESTSYSKSAHEMRHQECFALRSGRHGLLDVARRTFLQTVEDLYQVGEVGEVVLVSVIHPTQPHSLRLFLHSLVLFVWRRAHYFFVNSSVFHRKLFLAS